MNNPPLVGDADGQYMACPAGPAAELAALLPTGPVLELCCGVGGLTRELARELARAGRKVLAVDQSLERLRANRANLAALGLDEQVSYLCCDLRRAALHAPAGAQPFTAAVLDPDWSPPGRTPDEWTARLEGMDPPADELIRLGLAMSPLVVIRLPREISTSVLESNFPGLSSREINGHGRRWRWLALHEA